MVSVFILTFPFAVVPDDQFLAVIDRTKVHSGRRLFPAVIFLRWRQMTVTSSIHN